MSFNNSSLFTSCPFYRFTDGENIARRFALWLVIIVGILSNSFVIVVAGRLTVRKNLHHLIINMAVSDILFVILSVYDKKTFLASVENIPTGVFGDIVCKLQTLLYYVTFRVSLITLFVISIERYKATRRTLVRSGPYTLRRRIAIIATCWLVPLVYFSPYLLVSKVMYERACIPIPSKYDKYTYAPNVIAACLVFALLIGSIVFSILTIYRLYTNNKGNEDLMTQQSQERRARKIKAAVRMVVASVVLYTICWFPNLLWHVVVDIDNIRKHHAKGSYISFFLHLPCMNQQIFGFVRDDLLPLINSSFSPFIYIIFLADFRNAFLKLFCFRKEGVNERSTGTSSTQNLAMNSLIGKSKQGENRTRIFPSGSTTLTTAID